MKWQETGEGKNERGKEKIEGVEKFLQVSGLKICHMQNDGLLMGCEVHISDRYEDHIAI